MAGIFKKIYDWLLSLFWYGDMLFIFIDEAVIWRVAGESRTA